MQLNINVKQKHPKMFSEISICKKKDGKEIFRSEKFGNKITNYGLEKIHTDSSALLCNLNYSGKATSYMRVSTGTSDILETDVGLSGTTFSSFLDYSDFQQVTIESVNYVKVVLGTTYALGAVTGNLGQVGIFFSNTNTTMMFGTRIKDGAGIPTTIPVAADEQLFVEYTIYVEITNDPLGFEVITNAGIITLDGVDYPYDFYFNRRYLNGQLAFHFINPGWNSGSQFRLHASTTLAGSINKSLPSLTSITRNIDSVNKTATYNYEIVSPPSDGELYVQALVMQNNTSSIFNYSQAAMAIEFQNRIPKTALESLEFDVQITNDWSGV